LGRVIFLETGDPLNEERTQTSLAVPLSDDEMMLIDASSGTVLLRQLKAAGIPPGKVRHLFVSHRHFDHVGGLAPLLIALVPLPEASITVCDPRRRKSPVWGPARRGHRVGTRSSGKEHVRILEINARIRRLRMPLLRAERIVLKVLDEWRRLRELEVRREQLAELERDRETLIKHYAGMVPDALDDLSSQERHRIYKLLKLEIKLPPDETFQVSGTFWDEPLFCAVKSVPPRL
jgi:ribonuclease BN (tRNA processing enzyme)